MPPAPTVLLYDWDNTLVDAWTGVIWPGTVFRRQMGAGDAAADKPDAAPNLLAKARFGARASSTVWYADNNGLDMHTARAAGATAVLVGDAAHDGGVAQAAPDLNFASAEALAARLRGCARLREARRMLN